MSPNTIRSEYKAEQGKLFDIKKGKQKKRSEAEKEAILEENPVDTVFKTPVPQPNKKGKGKKKGKR